MSDTARQQAQKPSDLAARMRKVAIHDTPTVSAALPFVADQPPKEKRVRYTLDLLYSQHRFLKKFAFDAEVDASEVLRDLLTALEEDSTLASAVKWRVIARKQGRKG